MRKSTSTIIFALLFTLTVLVLGYVMLGLLPMFLFAFGFLGGFILWLIIPTNVSFSTIKTPYFLTLAFFVLHKYEELKMDFFPRLSEITGVSVPETNSFLVYLLYAFAFLWLFIPYLMKRKHSFGYYLVWTFFTGMATVVILAPTAWWGLYRLSRKTS